MDKCVVPVRRKFWAYMRLVEVAQYSRGQDGNTTNGLNADGKSADLNLLLLTSTSTKLLRLLLES